MSNALKFLSAEEMRIFVFVRGQQQAGFTIKDGKVFCAAPILRTRPGVDPIKATERLLRLGWKKSPHKWGVLCRTSVEKESNP